MTKKLLSAFLTLAMVLSLLPFGVIDVRATENTVSGETDGGVAWTLTESGVLALTGDYVPMDDFSEEDPAPWITAAEENGWAITKVSIPEDSLMTIGDCAFYNCYALESVEFPEDAERLTDICESAFEDCSSLASITFPDSLMGIGNYAFRGCIMLEDVMLPANLGSLGGGAFAGCASLEEITLDKGNTYFSVNDGVLFNSEETELIQFPAGYGYEYEVPDGVIEICSGAFADCYDLTSISLPASIAFIWGYAFENCYCLDTVYYRSQASQWESVKVDEEGNDYFFEAELVCAKELSGKCGESLAWTLDESGTLSITGTGAMTDYDPESGTAAPWADSAELIAGVTIASGATSIGSYAFSGCSAMESISIPASVTNVGDGAFYGCASLEAAELPSGVAGVGKQMFYGCELLASVTLPASVTSIGKQAFYGCAALESIGIPANTASIGEQAFAFCTALEGVTIPAATAEIGANAFVDCKALAAFAVDSGNETYASEEGVLFNKAKTALIQYPGAKNVDYTVPASVTTILDNAFHGASLTAVTVPATVTEMSGHTFDECASLASATILANIQALPTGTFFKCEALANVTLPQKLAAIGYEAFYGCTALKSLTIPASVTEIAGHAFYKSGLTGVELPAGLATLGDQAFRQCAALESLTIPGGIKAIGSYAFESCSSLRTVNLPSALETIGGYAFLRSGLTSISIPDSVSSIGTGAFQSCASLVSVRLPSGLTTVASGLFTSSLALKRITIPASVTTIYAAAFTGAVLTDIYYAGTETQWNAINKIAAWGANPLASAVIHYNSPSDFPAVSGSFDTSGALKATVTAPAGAVLLASCHDESGRLVSVKVIAINEVCTARAFDTGWAREADRSYKLMLVDGTTFAPLSPAWSVMAAVVQ